MGVIRVIDETMLDLLPSVTETSRLSCQIVYRTALDGLALRLGKTA
jgi:ferredoxin